MLSASVLSAASCRQRSVSRALDADAGAEPPSALDSGTVVAYSAARCADCHEPLYDEWTASAHSRADKSAIYLGMRGPDGRACDPCHSPLKDQLPLDSIVVNEGVTCEVCHSIVDVRDEGDRPTMKLELGVVKRGPLCDAKRHYFHSMGCSPLHAEARVCAGCHLYRLPVEGGAPVPVFTEYEEWQKSAGEAGISCQDCHMPGTSREVARGSAPRPNVPFHGFMGNGHLREQALTLTVAVDEAGSGVAVVASVSNVGAGHAVPTGLPGRQVVLRVVASDAAGTEVGRAERIYSRVLIDARGEEVPFPSARAVASDTRIMPGAPRRESFTFDVPSAGEVRAELVYRPLSPNIARAAGVVAPPEQVLASTKAAFGPRGARRALLRTRKRP